MSKNAGRYQEVLRPGEETIGATYQHLWSNLGSVYVKRSFFPATKTLISYQEYSDKKFTISHGKEMSFYDSGPIRSQGQNRDDKAVGTWTYYHEEGGISSIGEYVDGKRQGDWKYYRADSTLSATAVYVDGKFEGPYVRYDDAGKQISTAIYRDNKIVEQQGSLENSGDPFKIVERFPLFPGCEHIQDYEERKRCSDRELLTFIYSRIRYPSHARQYGVEGMAVVSFIIEKDGKVSDIKVVRGLDTDISEEVARIASLLPVWEPGTQDGVPVRVQFNLPIKFKLE